MKFGRVIFRFFKPTASDPDGNPIKREFTDAERRLMQRTAWEAIEAFHKGDFD